MKQIFFIIAAAELSVFFCLAAYVTIKAKGRAPIMPRWIMVFVHVMIATAISYVVYEMAVAFVTKDVSSIAGYCTIIGICIGLYFGRSIEKYNNALAEKHRRLALESNAEAKRVCTANKHFWKQWWYGEFHN